MIVSAFPTIARGGESVPLVVTAEARNAESAAARLDRVQIFIAPAMLPVATSTLEEAELVTINEALGADLARQLGEIRALSSPVRRLAQMADLTANQARILALQAGVQ